MSPFWPRFSQWVRRDPGSSRDRPAGSPHVPPEQIGRYRIVRKLGEGGMGIVYAARDEALDRSVAIKMIQGAADDQSRERLRREARAAAGVNHPNICQVYEIGEENGELYIAMEMLEGDPLDQRLSTGPLPLREALETTLGILAALEALHGRGIVHRDLKPSNVFLTPHGVKILDFGLARSSAAPGGTDITLTTPGTVLGTPRYLAPEQWAGDPATPRSDIFVVGAILYESVSGSPAFGGTGIPEIYHSVTQTQPPALTGCSETVAVDRVIQRALEKKPERRYPRAADMAGEIREILAGIDSGRLSSVRSMRRVIVLPFRQLRPDPEVEFLAFGLPDAITASLSGLDGLIVRSTAAATGFSGDNPDLKAIAGEADVDAVLMGTLIRSGDAVRVTAQLVEAPGGTLIVSKTAQVPLTDIFELQDSLARQIMEALEVPLTGEQASRHRDVPANPHAYELYLKASQVHGITSSDHLLFAARDLYLDALAEDPKFAPAWARLGRVYRIIGKYGHGDYEENRNLAREAFEKALQLNPGLSLAHNLYTYFEIEELGRPIEAMTRLLGQARACTTDPELFAGLVLACRFCGLLDASIEAHRRAQRLDPKVRTGIHNTYWMLGDFEAAYLHDDEDVPISRAQALVMLGRTEEAERLFGKLASRVRGLEVNFVAAGRAAVEKRTEDLMKHLKPLIESTFRDPEGVYTMAALVAYAGETEMPFRMIDEAIDGGFYCHRALLEDPRLASLRGDPRFGALLDKAAGRLEAARAAYLAADGEVILGPAR